MATENDTAGDPEPTAETAETSKEETVFCRDCGETISKRAEICPECGIRQRSPGGGSSAAGFEDKQPGIAAVASLVIPGAGQIYLGELNRGILFIVASAVAGVMSMFLIGIPFLFAIWVYAIYDAYNLASDPEE
ncbi:zinc ribbon domain-containing protein [Haloarchaeobius sp. TZWWS8]|uniref:zinc ribbon domain-containing protein n=1 Tax=Haloarchaeobius sp. TZWWS8 TaxID=3446121 RepID=UPI003EBAC553